MHSVLRQRPGKCAAQRQSASVTRCRRHGSKFKCSRPSASRSYHQSSAFRAARSAQRGSASWLARDGRVSTRTRTERDARDAIARLPLTIAMRRGHVPETRNCTSRLGIAGRGEARFGFGLESDKAHVTRTRRGCTLGLTHPDHHPNPPHPHAASRTRLRRLALDLDDGAVL
jgi:hypothetical protein